MPRMPDGLSIVVGLFTLLGGAELLVRGAAWFALVLGLRPMVVGVTIVAFGTSTPELVVSVVDVLQGSRGLAAGTVFGSNIANIALIVGLSALIRPMRQTWGDAVFESLFLVGITLLTPIALLSAEVGRVEGVVLVLLLALFVALVARRARPAGRTETPAGEMRARVKPKTVALYALSVVGGIAGLMLGAQWLVDGSKGMAMEFGVSESLAGQTIVAIGTSLPELATSVVAALRGQTAIALGNVIGSNIFNICMVLGLTAAVHPVAMTWSVEGPAVLMALVLTLLLVGQLRALEGIGRLAGGLYILAHVAYLTWSVAG
jgi:cation:H+ antiporter